MEETSEMTASGSVEETLQRLNVRASTTFPASLFRSRKSGQVLYLEAGKDFVDTLLSFLLLPVGTIIHMLTTGIQVKPALGGISSIFESVQNFSASDLQLAKENLVQPRPAAIGCACKSSGLPMQTDLELASILPKPLEKRGLYGDYYKCIQCGCLSGALKGRTCAACNPKCSDYTTSGTDILSLRKNQVVTPLVL